MKLRGARQAMGARAVVHLPAGRVSQLPLSGITAPAPTVSGPSCRSGRRNPSGRDRRPSDQGRGDRAATRTRRTDGEPPGAPGERVAPPIEAGSHRRARTHLCHIRGATPPAVASDAEHPRGWSALVERSRFRSVHWGAPGIEKFPLGPLVKLNNWSGRPALAGAATLKSAPLPALARPCPPSIPA